MTDWLWDTWENSCCICEFIEGVDVTDLINIKPTAPKLNIYIKTHKDNEPIRPVINNTLAPSYKIDNL